MLGDETLVNIKFCNAATCIPVGIFLIPEDFTPAYPHYQCNLVVSEKLHVQCTCNSVGLLPNPLQFLYSPPPPPPPSKKVRGNEIIGLEQGNSLNSLSPLH